MFFQRVPVWERLTHSVRVVTPKQDRGLRAYGTNRGGGER